jgi:hypothetical protein
MPRFLSVTLQGQESSFKGKTRKHAAERLQEWLTNTADRILPGSNFERAVKETVTINRVGDQWVIETSENGVGDVAPFDTREAVIAEFVARCLNDGEHWS